MKNILYLIILIYLFPTFLNAQCAGDIKTAEEHWRKNEFLEAFNDLLKAKICDDEKVRKEADRYIKQYFKEITAKYDASIALQSKITKKSEELEQKNIALDKKTKDAEEQRTIAFLNERLAKDALKKSIYSDSMTKVAKRNFRNGLTILFDYLKTQTTNFKDWVTVHPQYKDSLTDVIILMIDDSPTLQKENDAQKNKWKNSLHSMNSEDLHTLFSILGNEVAQNANQTKCDIGEIINNVERLRKDKKFREAIDLLLTAKKCDVDYRLYENIAYCYRENNQLDSAEFFGKEMLRLQMNPSVSLRVMRMVKSTKKEFRDAEYYAKRVIEAKQLENEPILVNDYGNLAYYQLFTHDYEGTLKSVELAYVIEQKNWLLVNKAHALLLLNRKEEAVEMYNQLKDKRDDSKTAGNLYFKKAIIDDIEELKKIGIQNLDFDTIIKLVNQ